MDAQADEQSRSFDRRRRQTFPWDALWTPARRKEHRRTADQGPFAFVDRYDESLGFLIVLILILTISDGLLTLVLIDLCCEEANPIMAVLIEHGPMSFVLGKYVMTAICLPVLLVFQHHKLFRTRFRVRHLFPTFVGLYLVLLSYQFYLLGIASELDLRSSALSSVATISREHL